MTGAQIAEAVRGETAKNKTRMAFRHDFKHRRCGDRAGDLKHDIWNDIARGIPSSGPQAYRNCRIKMSTGDMPDRIGHRHHGETESQGDADKTNSQFRMAAAMTALPQPPN